MNKSKDKFIFDFNNVYLSTKKLVDNFLSKYFLQSKVTTFKSLFPLQNNIVDLFNIINYFADFLLFDYIKIPSLKSNFNLNPEDEKILTDFYIKRNNFFISLLLEYCMVFKDTINLASHFEAFVKINNENLIQIDLIVEYYVLAMFDQKKVAISLLIKHNNYFKNIFKDNREIDPFTEIKNIDHEKEFLDYTLEEVWILRYMIKCVIKRKCFELLIYLINFRKNISQILMEGHLWKEIVFNFDEEEFMTIWKQFELSLPFDFKFIKTIHLSNDPNYAPGYKEFTDETKKKKTLGQPIDEATTLMIENYEIDLNMNHVYDLKTCLEICFKFNKIDHSYSLIYEYIDNREIVDKSIFEVCLVNNEDISM